MSEPYRNLLANAMLEEVLGAITPPSSSLSNVTSPEPGVLQLQVVTNSESANTTVEEYKTVTINLSIVDEKVVSRITHIREDFTE